jgi:hypothetical protein
MDNQIPTQETPQVQESDWKTRLALSFAKPNEESIKTVLRQKYGSGNFAQSTKGPHKGSWFFRNEESKNMWVPVDSESITPTDFIDVLGYLPEFLGGAGGGILGGVAGAGAGTPGGPPGMTAGVVAGSMAGGGVGRSIGTGIKMGIQKSETLENITGIRQRETTPEEDLTALRNSFFTGVAEEAVGLGLVGTAQKIVGPAAKATATKGAQAFKQFAEAHQLRPTPGTIIAGTKTETLERVLGILPLSSSAMKNRATINAQRLGEVADEFVASIGRPASALSAGRAVKSAADTGMDMFKAEADLVFNEVGQNALGVKIVLPGLKKYIMDHMGSDQFQKYANPKYKEFITELLDQIADPVKRNPKNFAFGTTPGDGIRALRTHISSLAGRPEVIESGADAFFKGAIKWINRDIENSLKRTGNDVLLESWKRANSWYGAQKNLYNSNLGQQLIREFGQAKAVMPESVIKLIRPRDITTVRELKKIIRTDTEQGKQAFDQLRHAWLTEEFKKLNVTLGAGGHVRFTVPQAKKFHSWINSFDETVLRELLSPREISRLRQLERATARMAESTSMVPQVASAASNAGVFVGAGFVNKMSSLAAHGGLVTLGMAGAGGAAGFAMGGNFQSTLAGAAVAAASPALLAHALLSKPVGAWMTSSITAGPITRRTGQTIAHAWGDQIITEDDVQWAQKQILDKLKKVQ